MWWLWGKNNRNVVVVAVLKGTMEMWQWWWWRENNRNVVVVVVEGKQQKYVSCAGKTKEMWWWQWRENNKNDVVVEGDVR